MIEVNLPDGRVLRFPEGTPENVMRDAIQRLMMESEETVQAPAGDLYTPANASMFPDQRAATAPNVLDPVQGDPLNVAPVVNAAGRFAGTGMDMLNAGIESATFGLLGDEARAAVNAAFTPYSYDQALQMEREREAQFRETNPGLAFGADIAGAFVPGLGIARAATSAPTMIGGAARGLLAGGAQGATYGAMEGEGGFVPRLENAGIPAAIGGVLGAAAAPAARATGALWNRLAPGAAAAARGAQQALGLDRFGARMVADALQRDLPTSAQALAEAGPRAVVAQAGPATQTLLDFAVNMPSGPSSTVASQLQDLTAAGGQRLRQALDDVLGAPIGATRAQRDLMRGTAQGRAAAYQAAYDTPIDYATDQARAIESLLGRVPERAIRQANEMMRTEGVQSAQILARVADDGTVSYFRMPDVRQIDYITRALNDMGGFGTGTGADQGRAFRNLAREMRTTLDQIVPAYREARNAGRDAIANREAVDFGQTLLSRAQPMDEVEDAIAGMTDGERAFAAQGLRDYFEEVMANTQRALTDRTMDAREAIRPVREMLSRAGQTKLTALLGDRAQQLIEAAQQTYSLLSMRAATAMNSRTAVREVIRENIDRALPVTPGEALLEGRGTLAAIGAAMRPVVGEVAQARMAGRDQIMGRVGQALLAPINAPGNPPGLALQLPGLLAAAERAAGRVGGGVNSAMGLLAAIGSQNQVR